MCLSLSIDCDCTALFIGMVPFSDAHEEIVLIYIEWQLLQKDE
jgi:hypothetical protein